MFTIFEYNVSLHSEPDITQLLSTNKSSTTLADDLDQLLRRLFADVDRLGSYNVAYRGNQRIHINLDSTERITRAFAIDENILECYAPVRLENCQVTCRLLKHSAVEVYDIPHSQYDSKITLWEVDELTIQLEHNYRYGNDRLLLKSYAGQDDGPYSLDDLELAERAMSILISSS